MIDSFPVVPRSTHVPEIHPIDGKQLLKRARKAKVWDKSVAEAREEFTEYEVAWLQAYYLVSTKSERKTMRRGGGTWAMPLLLRT